MKRPATISKQAAESLAIQALTFIAADPERIGSFLAASGIGPDRIRAAAREPRFLAGVLDHLAGNESLLVAFALHADINPFDVAVARDVLGGRSE
jgi:hypothetical protein